MDNREKYHRKSTRLTGYDYSREGLYFITTCTKDRQCLFGHIEKRQMILNDAGKIANDCWLQIPQHFPHAVLHEHVIMPNHVHGIIELNTMENVGTSIGAKNVGNDDAENAGNVGAKNFSPLHGSLHFHPINTPQPFKSPSKTIGSIVRGFKIGVTNWFRDRDNWETIWQRNYHDHIIRNCEAYEKICAYILNNPQNWKEDKFYDGKEPS